MANSNGNTPAPPALASPVLDTSSWMSDVQRALALLLIGSFAFVALFSTVFSIFAPNNAPLVDMAKTLQQALVNMSLIALGFFFGNTMAKMAQDMGQQKVVDKLTGQNPPGGPVAPVAQAEPWWNSLTDEERAAITAAGTKDKKVADFLAAPVTEKPAADDLKSLVSKKLLTKERAKALAK